MYSFLVCVNFPAYTISQFKFINCQYERLTFRSATGGQFFNMTHCDQFNAGPTYCIPSWSVLIYNNGSQVVYTVGNAATSVAFDANCTETNATFTTRNTNGTIASKVEAPAMNCTANYLCEPGDVGNITYALANPF